MSGARRRRVPRNAWNRGTAVHVKGNRVRLVWPCGCTKVEVVKDTTEEMTRFMVKRWRANGVVLRQCPKHPDWYDPKSQVARLNAEHPQS